MTALRVAFVTGATGFLGCAITRALLERGVAVRALTRDGALPDDLVARGAEPVRGDLDDPAVLTAAMRDADAVFHVAAAIGMWRKRWAESEKVNVDGTRHMVRAALSAGVRRFVFTSSASTIGKPLGSATESPVTVDETSAYNFAPLRMVYPHTKWLAEEEVWSGAAEGLEAVITHPTAIFGPGDHKLNVLPLFRATLTGAAFAAPGGMRTTCDVRDVATAHLAAAERGRPGERYILGGECLSVGDLLRRIAAQTGGRGPRFTLPDALVRGAGRALEALADLRDQPPTLSWEMALQSTFRACLSSDKASRELGYVSRPLDESLRDAVAWYRARGALGDGRSA